MLLGPKAFPKFYGVITMAFNSYKSLISEGLAAMLPTTPDQSDFRQFYFARDTLTLYVWSPVNLNWTGVNGAPAVAVGAALTAKVGLVYALDTAAGSVLTLPAAIGSGLRLTAYVKTSATSNAHKILTAPTTDKLIGRATGSIAAGTTLQFSAAAAAAYHSIQMPFAGTQPSGGLEGDIFNFTDVAAGVWLVEAQYESGTTSTTPFSTATT